MKHFLLILSLTLCSCNVSSLNDLKKENSSYFCSKKNSYRLELWYQDKETELCFVETYEKMTYIPCTPKVLKFIRECKE